MRRALLSLLLEREQSAHCNDPNRALAMPRKVWHSSLRASKGGSRLSRLMESLGPSALLVVVALNQMRLVTTGTLSPWKGGGFGMFATVDGPGARSVSCTGRNDRDGRIRVALRRSALDASLLNRLLIVPTEATLEEAAGALVRQEFVEVGSQSASLRDAIKKSNPDKELDLPVASLSEPMYRPRMPSDLAVSNDAVRRMQSVAVQVFRLVWEDRAASIRCQPLTSRIESVAR